MPSTKPFRSPACVLDGNGDRVGNAELTARGIDYTGTSSAIADADGQFEIEVRPNAALELVAASDEGSSDAMTISSGDGDFALELCLVVQGERGLEDFPVQIEGETGTIDLCVRDHECEDGDAIDVDVESRNVFSGEIVNEAMCSTLEVEAGRNYVIELTALNGTGFKGACDFADVNTGEIVVRGLNAQTQVWRHREGAGSQARIVVTTGIPQPFTILTTPPDATVRFVGEADPVYQAGMELVAGEYRVEISAPGYVSREVLVPHEAASPTRFIVELEALRQVNRSFVASVGCDFFRRMLYVFAGFDEDTEEINVSCNNRYTDQIELFRSVGSSYGCANVMKRAEEWGAEERSDCNCELSDERNIFGGREISWDCEIEATKYESP